MISSRVTERDSLLFVYGTLRPFVDIAMSRWLAGVARHVGLARTRGRLYDLGPYPGLVEARRPDDWVTGDLYRLPRAREVLRALDRYEGGPAPREQPRFCRVERPVWLACGVRRDAWLYLFRRTIVGRPRIASGDYRQHLDVESTAVAEWRPHR
jgi:gamma-glutamylcyclotransferase (GGCT)/AIG2-like uncharacterized protein YtfP